MSLAVKNRSRGYNPVVSTKQNRREFVDDLTSREVWEGMSELMFSQLESCNLPER
jgi:hypothetical protein